jgi:hypothetical protein
MQDMTCPFSMGAGETVPMFLGRLYRGVHEPEQEVDAIAMAVVLSASL